MALSRPFKKDCLALPLSTPLSSRPTHESLTIIGVRSDLLFSRELLSENAGEGGGGGGEWNVF